MGSEKNYFNKYKGIIVESMSAIIFFNSEA